MKLLSNEIHLWSMYHCDSIDKQFIADHLQLLNEQERAKQSRFLFEKHQHQYFLTRVFLRNVLSLYLPEVKPENWQFIQNAFGKPFIKNSGLSINLNFNLSHTNKMILLAVSVNPLIGVDVEYIARDNKVTEIADSYFAKDELDLLKSKLPHERKRCFFNLWTLKEAYIKAQGKGLSIPLNAFSFAYARANNIAIRFTSEHSDSPDDWQFWQFQVDEAYVAALAAKVTQAHSRYIVLKRFCRNYLFLSELEKISVE